MKKKIIDNHNEEGEEKNIKKKNKKFRKTSIKGFFQQNQLNTIS